MDPAIDPLAGAAAQRALRILHLSDSHLFGNDALHYDQVDTLAALRRVLERAGALGSADAVVLSGDLSSDGSAQSYRRLRALVEPWAAARGAAVVYAMGNHDVRAGFEEVLGDRESVTTVRGVRIVCLDSSVPGAGVGQLQPAQLGRLQEVLRTAALNGTVLVVHHPPVPAATALLGALELKHPEQLLEVCRGTDVRLILCGHYHHPLVTSVDGIPVVVAPGIANTSDALAPAGTERATVGSGFAVIELPATGAARAIFVSVPGPDDGAEIFNLTPEEVRRIAREAGGAQ
ncbi:MAG: metallophosphoesterase [Terrimesophilobacter sp.]